jgi:acyl-CoA thioester hydrolase
MRPPERRPQRPPQPAFDLAVRVYYQDTDAGGVVYHGTYLDYFERARSEWLRALGFDIGEMAQREGVVFIVRDLRIAYAKPARLDDLLAVSVAVEHLGRAQFTLFQVVRRDGEALVCASVNLACVAAGSFKPLRVPEAVRRRLEPAGAPAEAAQDQASQKAPA